MIYETPALTTADGEVLAAIDELRGELCFFLREPRRWFGSLRRATLARAVQGSNSIEGYHASVEDVAAVMEGEEPLEADEETRAAIAGYRDGRGAPGRWRDIRVQRRQQADDDPYHRSPPTLPGLEPLR